MCGIVGFLQAESVWSADRLEDTVVRMADPLRHRGPDDAGAWVDPDAGVALGFRRLSVVELSDAGHQPMVSPGGRYVLIFNGEIYNFVELRGEMERHGAEFRGHSDTEVLLTAMELWGIPRALRRANGMFAFAVWDRARRELTLARDRMGEKPLYYGTCGGAFLFGSELKALSPYPGFRPEIDRAALSQFFRHAYVPGPLSIYRGIKKLVPGTSVTVAPGAGTDPDPTAYWSFEDVATRALRDPIDVSRAEAADLLDRALRESIELRMIADVPLGAFLSGGIDSSTVVALMQETSTSPVKTFTIGFHEEGFDESRHARAVAKHLGTAHTELYLSAEEAMAVIPELPTVYDEPYADPSQIPTMLVSRLARSQVTVALSGDGGDELFGGYGRYFVYRNLERKFARFPPSVRILGARGITSVAPGTWDALWRRARPVLPRWARDVRAGDKAYRLAAMLRSVRAGDMYRNLMSYWDPSELVIGGVDPPGAFGNPVWADLDDDPICRAMAVDTVTYLPDDILAKVDRASMASSLEARVPLLDYRVVELAWQLPFGVKVGADDGKRVLRDVLAKYVPADLVDRPKMGFGVPIGEWLRGPLRQWAEDLLQPNRLEAEGYLAVDPVRKIWAEHSSGQHNWQYLLWNVLMFEAWLERTAPYLAN